jgi:hypothetical protein
VSEHILVVLDPPGHPDDERPWEVLHPNDCPLIEIGKDLDDVPYFDHNCGIAYEIENIGADAFGPMPEPGRYRMTHWSRKVGYYDCWDWESGIDLEKLE